MKLKNIIFDWSGVIKDATENHVWIINKMIEKYGSDRQIDLLELREIWEQPYMKFWNKIFPEMTLEEEQKIYKEIILSDICPHCGSYEGIVELIKKLKEKGFLITVLSSDLKDTIFPEIKSYGLENIFDEVVTDIHDKKEEIGNLIKRNNFNPEETAFVGDTNLEIEAGKLVGVKTIAVTWGFYSEDRLKKLNPDYIVHNVKELENILLS